MSPDGRNVCVAASGSSAISAFARRPSSGVLAGLRVPDGCTQSSAEKPIRGCRRSRGLAGGDAIALSLDGRLAYVTAERSDSVVARRRVR